MKYIIAALLFISSTVSAELYEGPELYVGTGKTVFNSHSFIQEVGMRKGGMDLQIAHINDGSTANGYQERVFISSVSFVPEIYHNVKLRLGVAVVANAELVSLFNFRVGLIYDLGDYEIELTHYSDAGIEEPNTGIDAAILRFKF